MVSFEDLQPPGSSTTALDSGDAQRQLDEARRNHLSEVPSLIALAIAYEVEKRFEDTAVCAQEALELSLDSKDERGEAYAQVLLLRARLFSGISTQPSTLRSLAKAARTFRSLEITAWEVVTLKTLLAASSSPSQLVSDLVSDGEVAERLRVNRALQEMCLSFHSHMERHSNRELRLAAANVHLRRGETEEAFRIAYSPSSFVIEKLFEDEQVLRNWRSGVQRLPVEAREALDRAAELFHNEADILSVIADFKADNFSVGRDEEDSLDSAQASLSSARSSEDRFAELIALCRMIKMQLKSKHGYDDIIRHCQEVLDTIKSTSLGGVATAAASCALAAGHLLMRSSMAISIAKEAREAARCAGDKVLESFALQILSLAHLSEKAVDEALKVTRDWLKVSRRLEIPSEAAVTLFLSKVHLAADDPGQAVRTAEEALDLAVGNGVIAQHVHSDALRTLVSIHSSRGKPGAALRAAQKLLEISSADNPREKSLAQLLIAEASPSAPSALPAVKDALVAAKNTDEALAQMTLSTVLLSQRQRAPREAVEAARRASNVAAAMGQRRLEAAALCSLGAAQIVDQDTAEAEKSAQAALKIFHEETMSTNQKREVSIGEARARELLATAQVAGLAPKFPRLFVDDFDCAHLEINEMATQETLEAVVSTLHKMTHVGKKVKAVVMHLEGIPGPNRLHSYALSSGQFIVGLRAVGVPIVLSCWGTIAGPSWSLFLAADYRIVSGHTKFMLPIISPPECLGDLVGQSVAAQLVIASGTLSAQALLEMGVIHQCRPGKDESSRAATEMAKRIASFPSIACKQTMSLLSVPPMRYAAIGSQRLPS